MYGPSWIQSILLIRPIFTLGPRPSGHSRQWFVGAKTYASENVTLSPVKCKPVTFAALA